MFGLPAGDYVRYEFEQSVIVYTGCSILLILPDEIRACCGPISKCRSFALPQDPAVNKERREVASLATEHISV
jgi:hypothetical protein